MRNLGLAAAILLCAGSGAIADTAKIVHGATAAKIDAVLAAAVPSGFGGAVLVEKNGEIVLRAGYGMADREAKIPFTVDTIAQIGSITKSMTAIAILQLAEEGKLDLKAQAKTYLPGTAEPARSATLHLLLTHHAGLADTCGDDFDSVSKADLVAPLHGDRASPIPPARITTPTWPTASWPPSWSKGCRASTGRIICARMCWGRSRRSAPDLICSPAPGRKISRRAI